MLLAFGTAIAALFGLAFGSFLNVCASRLPEGEGLASPASHCRSCGRPLRWRENIPLVSWMALGGRCSSCGAPIGRRHPVVELAVAVAWGVIAWQALPAFLAPEATAYALFDAALVAMGRMILCWLLILLAVLDAEHFWLPDRLTLGGAVLGIPFALVLFGHRWVSPRDLLMSEVVHWLAGLVIAPGIILVTRWTYRVIRHREGIGLGDAKLMLLLAVWLGLAHTLVAFVVGVTLGAGFAMILLAVPAARRDATAWALTKLPLGTFLCVGGVLSALWGTPLIAAYLRAAGF